MRGWGNKDDVGDVRANLFPTPLFFLERVRETRRTEDTNSRRHKVRYFRFETTNFQPELKRKYQISKSKRRLYRPVKVALQTEILGKYTYIVPFIPIDCSSYFIVSQYPVRKDQFSYCFSTQNSNSASIPIKPIWPSLWTGLCSIGELGRGTPFLSLSLLFFSRNREPVHRLVVFK